MAAGDRIFWAVSLEKEQLLPLFEGQAPSPTRKGATLPFAEQAHGKLLAAWCAERNASLTPLPQLIIVPSETVRELYLWNASYLRSFGPLSSHMRILTSDRIRMLKALYQPQTFKRYATSLLGLILAEVIFNRGDRTIDISVQSEIERAHSFTLSKSWMLGYTNETLRDVTSRAVQLRAVLGANSRVDPAVVSLIFYVACEINTEHEETEIYLSSTRELWGRLSNGEDLYTVAAEVFSEANDLFRAVEADDLRVMTAEARVTLFRELAPVYLNNIGPGNRLRNTFAIAFALFLCRPGLSQQLSIYRDQSKLLPEIILWLGLLQRFSSIGELLTSYSGAGLRIQRELFRSEDPWQVPRSDINADEFLYLWEAKSKTLQIDPNRDSISIELIPMVAQRFGTSSIQEESLPTRNERLSEEARQRERDRADRLELVERKLDESLYLLRDLRRKDEGADGRTGRKRR